MKIVGIVALVLFVSFVVWHICGKLGSYVILVLFVWQQGLLYDEKLKNAYYEVGFNRYMDQQFEDAVFLADVGVVFKKMGYAIFDGLILFVDVMILKSGVGIWVNWPIGAVCAVLLIWLLTQVIRLYSQAISTALEQADAAGEAQKARMNNRAE